MWYVNVVCRFRFPMDVHGFAETFDATGQKLASVTELPDNWAQGASFEKGKLIFWRNHSHRKCY